MQKIFFFTIIIFNILNYTVANNLTTNQTLLLQQIDAKYTTYKSIKSKFTQIDHLGNSTNGWFVIERPKKARIEYDTLKIRFIANADSLLFDDLNQNQKTMLPLKASVFSHLLEENQSLLNANTTILNFIENTNTIEIQLADKNNLAMGNITLVINKENGQIKSWKLQDATGAITTITLQNPQFNTVGFKNNSIFNLQRVRHIKFEDIE